MCVCVCVCVCVWWCVMVGWPDSCYVIQTCIALLHQMYQLSAVLVISIKCLIHTLHFDLTSTRVMVNLESICEGVYLSFHSSNLTTNASYPPHVISIPLILTVTLHPPHACCHSPSLMFTLLTSSFSLIVILCPRLWCLCQTMKDNTVIMAPFCAFILTFLPFITLYGFLWLRLSLTALVSPSPPLPFLPKIAQSCSQVLSLLLFLSVPTNK